MLLSFTPNLSLTSSPIFSWFVGSTSLQVPFSDIFRSFFFGQHPVVLVLSHRMDSRCSGRRWEPRRRRRSATCMLRRLMDVNEVIEKVTGLWFYYGNIMVILWFSYANIMAILWQYYGDIMPIIKVIMIWTKYGHFFAGIFIARWRLKPIPYLDERCNDASIIYSWMRSMIKVILAVTIGDSPNGNMMVIYI